MSSNASSNKGKLKMGRRQSFSSRLVSITHRAGRLAVSTRHIRVSIHVSAGRWVVSTRHVVCFKTRLRSGFKKARAEEYFALSILISAARLPQRTPTVSDCFNINLRCKVFRDIRQTEQGGFKDNLRCKVYVSEAWSSLFPCNTHNQLTYANTSENAAFCVLCVNKAEFGCTAMRFKRYEGVTPNICVSPRTLKMTILMHVMFLYWIAQKRFTLAPCEYSREANRISTLTCRVISNSIKASLSELSRFPKSKQEFTHTHQNNHFGPFLGLLLHGSWSAFLGSKPHQPSVRGILLDLGTLYGLCNPGLI